MKPGILLRLLSPAIALSGLVGSAFAHPVAQGSVSLEIDGSSITAELRVSNEQIFVAGSLGEGAAEAGNFEDLLAQHGSYVLRHFSIAADGSALAGQLVETIPPEDRSVNGFTSYVMLYRMPPSARQLEVRQDLLTEIFFAPGNRWEAPLVARVSRGERPLVDAALLTSTRPLRFALPSSVSAEFTEPLPATARLGWDYFQEGLRHISGGWDHALFVAALVLAMPGFWRVLALVTVFTLAHTVTLTLGVLGWVPLRSSVVEPLIAASIVVAAALTAVRPASPLLRWRLAVAFGFGLFHGLGFAGGLAAAMEGFAPSAVAAAIAGFSVGVELGHQLLVLPLLGGMAVLRRWKPDAVSAATRVGGVAICVAGAWMLANLW